MEKLPCPGCRTPLAPEAAGCPICLRARTKHEITRGYARLREETARRRRRPFQITAAVLLLGAAATLSWRQRLNIKAAAASARAAVRRWSDEMTDPGRLISRPASAPPPLPLETLPPLPPAEIPETPPAAPKPPPAKNAWRVSGLVYDLATLRPVPGADVVFTRQGRPPLRAMTDASGRYEADLPKGEGWSVSLRAPDRRRGQILDLDPSYRVRDADERRAAIRHLTDADLSPAPVAWSRARSAVTLDLVAVPRGDGEENGSN